MTQISTAPSLPAYLANPLAAWRGFVSRLRSVMPKGLYARSLLIVILPMVILQTVVTYVFLERHWQLVTRQLSTALVQDISAVIDVHNSYPQDKNDDTLTRIAQERMNIDMRACWPRRSAVSRRPRATCCRSTRTEHTMNDETRNQLSTCGWVATGGPRL